MILTPFLSDLVPIACEIVLPRGNDLLRKSRESFWINQYDSTFLELIPESNVLLITIIIFPCNSVRIYWTIDTNLMFINIESIVTSLSTDEGLSKGQN